MHPVLQIAEVLDIIFNDPNLQHPPTAETSSSLGENPYTKYPLLAAALTCRTFCEPALRLLWRQIDGMDRLVQTLSTEAVQLQTFSSRGLAPKDLYSGERGRISLLDVDARRRGRTASSRGKRSILGYMVYKKEPVEEDWQAFERYAAYVREFGNLDTGTDKYHLDEGIYQAIERRFTHRGIPILPNLRILTCGGCRQFRYTHLLLSPKVHTLRICWFPCDSCFSCIENFIQTVKADDHPCGNLQTVHMPAIIPNDVGVSFSALLMKYSRLKNVSVPTIPITLDALRHMLEKENLEELTVKVATFNMSVLGKSKQRHMRRFHLESETTADGAAVGGDLEDRFYSTLAGRLQAPELVRFTFKGGPQHPFAQDIRAFLELLSTKGYYGNEGQTWQSPSIILAPAKLSNRAQSLRSPFPEDERICTFANSFYLLCQPLPSNAQRSCFSQLCCLELRDTIVDLSDEEAGMMARSLPCLRHLAFEAMTESGIKKSRTTLIGVWLLAKHCRGLESLRMRIHAILDWDKFKCLAHIEDDSERENAETRQELLAMGRNESLCLLDFGSSTVEESSIVIDFIHLVSPRVCDVLFDCQPGRERSLELWDEIRDRVCPTSGVRASGSS